MTFDPTRAIQQEKQEVKWEKAPYGQKDAVKRQRAAGTGSFKLRGNGARNQRGFHAVAAPLASL